MEDSQSEIGDPGKNVSVSKDLDPKEDKPKNHPGKQVQNESKAHVSEAQFTIILTDPTPVPEKERLVCTPELIVIKDKDFVASKDGPTNKLEILTANFLEWTIDSKNSKVSVMRAILIYKYEKGTKKICKLAEVKSESKGDKRNIIFNQKEKSETMDTMGAVAVGGVPNAYPCLIARFITAHMGNEAHIRHYLLQQVNIEANTQDNLIKMRENKTTNDDGGFLLKNFYRSQAANPPNAFSYYLMQNKIQIFFKTNDKDWVNEKKNRFFEANYADRLCSETDFVEHMGISSDVNSDSAKKLDDNKKGETDPYYLTVISNQGRCIIEEIQGGAFFKSVVQLNLQLPVSTVNTSYSNINYLSSMSAIFRLGFSYSEIEGSIDRVKATLLFDLIPFSKPLGQFAQLPDKQLVGCQHLQIDLQKIIATGGLAGLSTDKSKPDLSTFYFLSSDFLKKPSPAPPLPNKQAEIFLFVLRKKPVHQFEAVPKKTNFGWFVQINITKTSPEAFASISSYTITEIDVLFIGRQDVGRNATETNVLTSEDEVRYLSCLPVKKVEGKATRSIIISYVSMKVIETIGSNEPVVRVLWLSNIKLNT